jgi:hypothetical protein
VRSDDEAKWSELEQAFFDAAPPDEPGTPPAHLDDSPLIGPAPRDRLAELRLRSRAALAAARASLQELVRKLRAAPWFTAFTAPRLTRRAGAIGLASAIVLMGLSAGVVASLRGNGSNVPVAPLVAVPAVASTEDPSGSDLVHPRASAGLRSHPRAAKHSRARASAAKHAQQQHRKAATGHSVR